MSKLVLIDGNAIMHRAFHALPQTLVSAKGELTNAVYGFTSMLLRIISDLTPTHFIICFDRKEPTFRKKEFKEYQAHRPETDKGLSQQFDKARAVAASMSISVYDKAGFEADDVIGTLAKQARGIDEIVIVTGDRDILQLVNAKVKVYLPIKGLSVAKMVGEKEVEEMLGVDPVRIVDYKALVGDPSDNYKGIPGIGPKGAVKLLKEFGTFPAVYKNLDKIGGAVAQKLKDGKDSGKMSYMLAKIVTNVPVKLDIKKARGWKVDDDEVLKLFKEYSFRTLANRALILGKKIEEKKQMKLL